MKLYVLFVVLLFFIVTLGCTSTNIPVSPVNPAISEYTTAISEDQYNGFTTYLNETEMYSVKYPLNSTIQQNVSLSQVVFTLQEPVNATKNNPYKVGNYFIVYVHQLSEYPNKTPDGIWDYKYSQLKNKGSNVTDIITQPITFRGNPGNLVSCTVNNSINGENIRTNVMEINVIKNGKVYEITYLGNPDSFETYLPIAKKMFNSFTGGA